MPTPCWICRSREMLERDRLQLRRRTVWPELADLDASIGRPAGITDSDASGKHSAPSASRDSARRPRWSCPLIAAASGDDPLRCERSTPDLAS